MASPTMHALMNRMPYLQSKAFSWTPAHLFFAYWKCILHIPQPSQHILYRINNLFLNFLLQLDLPVIIFWVNRITKPSHPSKKLKNYLLLDPSLPHSPWIDSVLLFCLWHSCLNKLSFFSLEGYNNWRTGSPTSCLVFLQTVLHSYFCQEDTSKR